MFLFAETCCSKCSSHCLVPRPLSSTYIYLLWPVRFRIHVSTSQPEDQIWPSTQLRMIPKQYTSSNCSCGLQSTWKKAEIAPLCPDTDPASWVGPRYVPSLLSVWKRLENGDLIAQQPKTENVNLGNFLRYAWNSWRYHGNSTQSVSKITAVIKSPDDKQHTCIEYWSLECLEVTVVVMNWITYKTCRYINNLYTSFRKAKKQICDFDVRNVLYQWNIHFF